MGTDWVIIVRRRPSVAKERAGNVKMADNKMASKGTFKWALSAEEEEEEQEGVGGWLGEDEGEQGNSGRRQRRRCGPSIRLE